MPESQTTVRNAGRLLLLRAAQVASGFLFASLIPRLMGPDTYGRYALLTSLALWFSLVSELGFTQVMGRFGPGLATERAALKQFFERLLTARVGSGTVSAALYLLLTLLWLREMDPWVLILVAGAVCLRALANQFFMLFLGVNRADRWGLGQVLRAWVNLAFLPAGFLLGGLVGAGAALLLSEAVVLSAGIWWGRRYVGWPGLRTDWLVLSPQLRFGLVFFASGLLQTAFQRSGAALIRVMSGDYAQVGFFGLAQEVFLVAASAFPQFALAFSPMFVTNLEQGQQEAVQRWAERLVAGMAAGGVLVVYAVLLLGDDLVPLVLGDAYRPVTANLLPLTASLIVLALGSVAHLLALVCDRPRTALAASAVRLAVFWLLGPFLIRWGQGLGASLTVLTSSVVYAVLITTCMQRVLRYSLRKWLLVVGLGVVFLPLNWFRSVWWLNAVLYGIVVVGYGGLLIGLKVVTWREISRGWRSVVAWT